MSRLVPVLLLLPLVAGFLRAETPEDKKTDLETLLRKLEKDIEKVRGLKFKKPVLAKIIARPKDAGAGIQGYYDLKKKALFVYDDIKGSYKKGVLIHEMVHALQDQHFNLAKLHSPVVDDAERAMAALIEGDAMYTTIEMLEKDQPAIRHMLKTQLNKKTDLQRAFTYGQGAKYVEALKKKGGWAAVNVRYRFLRPQSTAEILHPGERITTINLGPGKTRGEYGLLELLHTDPRTIADSVAAASGWKGDRLIEDDKATGWLVAFQNAEQAKRFVRALVVVRGGEHPKAKSENVPDGKQWTTDKGVRVVLRRGARVLDLAAPDVAGLRKMRDRLEGPPDLVVWSAKEKKKLTFGELTDRLVKADLVCVGESHDSELHHRIQLMVIKALYARDENLGVGMEMFGRPYQKVLDRYLAGAIDEETMLADTEYPTRWGYDWELYRPIVSFCRRNEVALAALNVTRELTRRVSQVGYDKLTEEEKKKIGKVDFQVKEHRAHWYERLAAMHGQTKVPAERKERSYQAMTVWDEYMADSAATFYKDRGLRRMVILAGSGHIDRGFGIPQRAAKRSGGKVATIHVAVGVEFEKATKEPVADFILVAR